MALQLWLPLDGSLRQNGCSSVETALSGPTVVAGKIGNCYQFDGSDDYISLTGQILYDTIQGGDKPFSIAMWIYHADTTRAVLFGDYGLSGAINFNIELSTAHNVRFYWNGSPDNAPGVSSVGAATWTHIAITYSGTKLIWYKNGIEVYSVDVTLSTKTKTTGSYYLGRDSRTGSTVLNGRLNDFRLYDHCLSATEVLEIAQGLVLHLKLDDYQQYSSVLFDVRRADEWTGDGCTVEQYDANTIKMTDNGTGNRRIYHNTTNVWTLNGATYRISFKAKADTAGTILRLSRSIVDYSEDTSLTTSYISYTKYITTTTATTGGTISLQSNTANGVIYIQDLTIDRILVYDSSGYGHDGQYACGNAIPSTTTDSAGGRYIYKAHFNATNKKVIIPNLVTSGFGSTYTFAWWSCQSTFTGVMNWGFLNGVRLNGLYNGNTWNTNDGSNNPLYNPGTTTQVTVPTTGVWYHWAMVADGTTCKVYKNGELWAQAKTFKTISGTTLILNGYNLTTNYSCDNLKMSDFRLYSTALSEDYIKLLAKGLAKLDNHYKVHGIGFYETAVTQSTTESIDPLSVSGGSSSSYGLMAYSTAGSTQGQTVTQTVTGTQYTSSTPIFEIPAAGYVSINIPYCQITYNRTSYSVYRWVRQSNGRYSRQHVGTYYLEYYKYYVYLDLYDENQTLITTLTYLSAGQIKSASSSSGSSSTTMIGAYSQGQSKTFYLPNDYIIDGTIAKYARVRRICAGGISPQSMIIGYTYTQNSGGGYTQTPQYGTRNTITISRVRYHGKRFSQANMQSPWFMETESNVLSANEAILETNEFIQI